MGTHKKSMAYWLSLVGAKYGRITITRFSHVEHSRKYYECICDCGKNLLLCIKTLKNGNTISCGCRKREVTIARNHSRNKDGSPVKAQYKKEYETWAGIKTRCYNKHGDAYAYYGGRGIAVCDRWLESFYNFIEDMGRSPSPNHSIERIENNGNYEPTNCRWATTLEQNKNKRDTILVTYKGKTDSLRGWCVTLNKNYQTIYGRVRKGCTPIQALTITERIPPGYPVKKYMIDMKIPEQ